MSSKKYKSIFYCANVPGKNAGNRRDYFIENSENLLTFHYQLGYSSDPSQIEKFSKGKSLWKKEFEIYTGKNPLIRNGIYYLVFAYLLLFHVPKNTFVIVTTPIYCVFNSIFKLIKGMNIVYWIEDYFPPSGSLFMKIYNFLVNYYNKRLKFVLYISPPVAKIYGNLKFDNKKIREIVTLGIKPQKNESRPRRKATIGFIGIVRKEQGLDLALDYIKSDKDSTLEIVGKGYDLDFYKQKVKKMKIDDRVVFYGPVENPIKIISKWNLGIALYHESKDNFSIYSEPSKIKTYFSFGLPVITTRATYFYKELEEYNAGVVIMENVKELSKSIDKLMKDYPKYLEGVRNIVKKYNYTSWYGKKLSFLLD